MIVKDAVDKAIQTAYEAYVIGERETEPQQKMSFGRLVALQAIANVLDVEFTEVARQYLTTPTELQEEKARADRYAS